MRVFRKLIGVWLTAILVMGHLTPQAVFGLTVSEEEKMARSFLNVIYKYFEVIEDPVVVNYVNKVGNRIVAGLAGTFISLSFFRH